MNTKSAGINFPCGFPISGKVIFVPFDHPGCTWIVSISCLGTSVFLQTKKNLHPLNMCVQNYTTNSPSLVVKKEKMDK
jgi:hypothetical protein